MAAPALDLPADQLAQLLGAVDDRLEVATPDQAGALRDTRRALELELARQLAPPPPSARPRPTHAGHPSQPTS